MSNRWNNKVWDKLSKEDLIPLVNDLWFLSEKYEERIHNAIEYIEKVESVNKELKDSDMYWAYNTFFPELLDILKGSDKE